MRSGHSRSRVLLAVAALLAFSATRAWPPDDDAWQRVETSHFTLIGNAEQARIVAIGENLELLREVLARSTEGLNFASPLPTTIYVFKDWDSMTPYSLVEDGQPRDLDGYFLRTDDGNYVAVNAASEALPFAVIYHEYLHYLLENSLSAIPLWLNEGMAEFYSTFQLVEGGAVFGLPMEDHLFWLASNDWMSLDALFEIDTASEDYNEGDRQSTFYAESWALTHYLMTDPARRDRFGQLLARLERGTPSVEALETTFDTELLVLEKATIQHALSGAMKLHKVSLEDSVDAGEIRVEPMARKEVLVRLGDLLIHRLPLQVEAGEKHLLGALALDETYPDAKIALATLRIHQQRFSDAVSLASEVVSANPELSRAYALRGAARLEQVLAAVAADPENFADLRPKLELARADYRRALESGPDLVWALDGLGATYVFETENVEEGLSALAQAFQLRPARTETLVRLISVTAISGNVEGAQTLLARVLRPRGNAEATRLAEEAVVRVQMERVLQLLMANEIDPALALLRQLVDETTTPEVRSDVARTLAKVEREYRAELLRREAIAAGAAGDRERAEELMRQAGEIYGHGDEAENQTAQFNAAVEAANNGELEAALETFERIAADGIQPDLKTMAAHHAERIRSILERNRQVRQYNLALEALRNGELERAEELLVNFLAQEPDEDHRGEAEKLLRTTRRRLERSNDE